MDDSWADLVSDSPIRAEESAESVGPLDDSWAALAHDDAEPDAVRDPREGEPGTAGVDELDNWADLALDLGEAEDAPEAPEPCAEEAPQREAEPPPVPLPRRQTLRLMRERLRDLATSVCQPLRLGASSVPALTDGAALQAEDAPDDVSMAPPGDIQLDASNDGEVAPGGGGGDAWAPTREGDCPHTQIVESHVCDGILELARLADEHDRDTLPREPSAETVIAAHEDDSLDVSGFDSAVRSAIRLETTPQRLYQTTSLLAATSMMVRDGGIVCSHEVPRSTIDVMRFSVWFRC